MTAESPACQLPHLHTHPVGELHAPADGLPRGVSTDRGVPDPPRGVSTLVPGVKLLLGVKKGVPPMGADAGILLSGLSAGADAVAATCSRSLTCCLQPVGESGQSSSLNSVPGFDGPGRLPAAATGSCWICACAVAVTCSPSLASSLQETKCCMTGHHAWRAQPEGLRQWPLPAPAASRTRCATGHGRLQCMPVLVSKAAPAMQPADAAAGSLDWQLRCGPSHLACLLPAAKG